MLRKMLLTAGALLLSAGMALAEMPKQINFGIISTESSTALEAGFFYGLLFSCSHASESDPVKVPVPLCELRHTSFNRC